MAIIRWDPIRGLDTAQSDMNRMFDRFFAGPADGSAMRPWVPAMDLIETDDALVLRADLPGMSEEDVQIEIKGGVLVLTGERHDEQIEQAEGFHRVERSFGRFSRSLGLPPGIEAESVTATFDCGVLEVKVPKPEPAEPTRVEIEGASVEGTGTEK
jgi:HSP20 family protein